MSSATATTNDAAPIAMLKSGMHHSPSITSVDQFASLEETAPAKNVAPPSAYADLPGVVNCASRSLGARVLFATDEWFAHADNLLVDAPPQFDPDAYCLQGKVLDGWESRRRREAGHDWCLIQLPHKTQIQAVELDTAHFTGNHVPAVSLQVVAFDSCETELSVVQQLPGALDRLLHGSVRGHGTTPDQVAQAAAACENLPWQDVLEKTPLRPGYEPTRLHSYDVSAQKAVGTLLRLNYYPDGGVARLRVWGQPVETPERQPGPAYAPIRTGATCTVVGHMEDSVSHLPSQSMTSGWTEVSAHVAGGRGVTCSNQHYGEPWNLIQSNYGRDMGDGWETARHPDRPSILHKHPTTGLVDSPLCDWCILQLGQSSTVKAIVLDTKHFRGNYPESVRVEGCCVETVESMDWNAVEWFPVVTRCRMAPDSEHLYEASKDQLACGSDQQVSHLRVTIFPDGGLSRVRVYA